MKNKTSKLLVALFVLICFALPVFVGNMETEAADTTYIVETYAFDAASPYFKNNTAPTCKTDGYIFAGWYAEDDTVAADETTGEAYFAGYPLVTIVGYMHENVQALFVEESVLDVKGQIAITEATDDGNANVMSVTEGTTANLRLVTSVDSLKYQQVGFEVSYTYGETTYEKESVTNYVYKQLKDVNGTDATDEVFVQPNQIFSNRSQYFKACTVSDIPTDAFEVGFSVRAYWTTADGATVYGSSTAVSKSVQEGIYHTYEAGIDTTYYKVLEDAVATVGDTDVKTVTLLKDAEVASDMAITGNVTITNREGANVTIYRDSSLTDANMMSVSANTDAVLNIVGTTDENSIVIDGRTSDGEEVVGVTMLYSDTAATLNIKNVTLKNAKNTKSNDGGAIHTKAGTLIVENVKFVDNYSKYGAAIRTTSATTIKNCVFGEEDKGNQVTTQGGAIYIQTGATVNVFDTEFTYNSSSSRGGAIYLNKGTLNVRNSKFDHNTATTSGGAIYNAGAEMTFIAENEEGDSTLAVFEYNVANDSTDAMGGGAILTGNATGVLDITGYVFRGNSAKKTGGAICARNGEVTITEAQFVENHTSGDNGHGGAVAYAYASAADFTVTNTTFTGNYTEGSTAHGGAVYVADSTKTTVNTDITTVNTFDSDKYGLNYVTSDDSENSSDGSNNGVYIAK